MFKHEITILKDTFGRLLRRHAQTNLIKLINKTHPADLAIVFRYFDDDEQGQVFSLMQDNKHTIEFLIATKKKLISIFFNSKTYDLAGWKTIDIYQKEVIFQINNLEKNIDIDDKRFKLPTLN